MHARPYVCAVFLVWLAWLAHAETSAVPNEPAEDLHIHEIVPPLDWPNSPVWYWVGSLVILGLIGGAVVWVRRDSLRKVQPAELPAPDKALQALEELFAGGELAPDDITDRYQQATDILRHYLEDQFGLPAHRLTSREFLASQDARLRLHASHRELLHMLLAHCDLVKFAGYQPHPEDVTNLHAYCRLFIERTRHGI